jgi:hypothetical protein
MTVSAARDTTVYDDLVVFTIGHVDDDLEPVADDDWVED